MCVCVRARDEMSSPGGAADGAPAAPRDAMSSLHPRLLLHQAARLMERLPRRVTPEGLNAASALQGRAARLRSEVPRLRIYNL